MAIVVVCILFILYNKLRIGTLRKSLDVDLNRLATCWAIIQRQCACVTCLVTALKQQIISSFFTNATKLLFLYFASSSSPINNARDSVSSSLNLQKSAFLITHFIF
ncbi:unnamed protein product [Albugo candida]|uniref:Uncharacterized protein n=1 Tax=Albugo candida TaxID=65357 RepID=A0A024G200_9STRA|nr:unnamed protein product [Albugo candida]|eukprot:CCI40581.1 unnamed protein product [Albugo candida]